MRGSAVAVTRTERLAVALLLVTAGHSLCYSAACDAGLALIFAQ